VWDPCDAIDLLFVIDNSSSMEPELERLMDELPAFIGATVEAMPASSWHIGVLTSDSAVLVDSNEQFTPCFGPNVHHIEHSGPSTIVLESQVACVLDGVGASGSSGERSASSTIVGLGDLANAPGGVNAGFSRSWAKLVVIFVSDEDDRAEGEEIGSIGDPEDWAEALTMVRGGEPDAIMSFGLLGRAKPNACPLLVETDLEQSLAGEDLDAAPEYAEFAEPATRLEQLVLSFAGGEVEDICVDSYAAFLTSVTSSIVAHCE